MYKIFILFFFLFSNSLWSNQSELDAFLNLIKNQDFDAADKIVDETKEEELKSTLFHLTELLVYKTSDKVAIIDSNDSDEIRFIKLLILGYQSTYLSKQNNLKAFSYFFRCT